ncbi:MAG: YbhB/YbcL family Raf kinase inhibitor-like protein [Acidobacteriota bacterium]|nr:YbhB/YbcL family Raf kinase inhibitor-like protein [Acidobacteriota bacterium]
MTRKIAFCTVMLASGIGTAFGQAPPPGAGGPTRLTLSSPDFEDGGIIPNKYTQADANPVSPKLEWKNAPDGTVSFLLLMHDPDIAKEKKTDDVTHWIAFNIPGAATGLAGGQPADAKLPDGTIQLLNNRSKVGYLGPGAPPIGPYHHYTFELMALDTKLDLGPGTTRDQVIAAVQGHIVGKGILVGRFHRPIPQ